ncbi:MAG: chromosomal replication initiator protein DnaA [Bacteroidales bacterium]|jgi:chromosomal replication initiator protein|nr:chromosomal replication initiator protein DnaA [Bacteroidales bacterium]MBR5912219.1 chromosomal replication initiator protein DnaA [Bacteroidales bacterium]
MSGNHVEIWNNCLSVIKDNVTEEAYKTWFEPIVPVSLENNLFILQVPSPFFAEFLDEHHLNLLKPVIKRFAGEKVKLAYKLPVDSSASNGTMTVPSSNRSVPKNPIGQPPPQRLSDGPINPFVIPGLKKLQIDSQLNENYTFDNFIEGDCNRLARSAGMKIAKEPGKTAFNPLVIYSGTGLGKTHLCHAIGLETKRLHPEKTVLYVQAEQLSTQYVTANKNNNRPDFINFYQMIDVLIIDDIQFLAGKAGTQDVFFHIFNHLQQNNKQIVITSDKFPSELQGMEDRLLSRFKWGLAADLQAPDLSTRTSIIREKLYDNGITFPDEVVQYIASNVRNNIRELEGVMNSLMAQSLLNKRAVTLEMAQQIIDRFVRNTVKEVSVEYIINIVCEYFKISPEQLALKTRKRQVVQARQIAMYLAKKYSNASLAAIGQQCGKKDHATVHHACKTIANQLETDKQFKVMFADIEKKIALQ